MSKNTSNLALSGRTLVIAPHHFADLEREHALGEELGVQVIAASNAEEFRAALASAAVVMVTPYVRLTADDIVRIPTPAAIVRYGVGYDNIDVEAARAVGIPVSIVPDSSVGEVASHAFAMGIALARRLTAGDKAIRTGNWAGTIAYDAPPFEELRVGLIGFGRIGQQVARLYASIGAQVCAYDPIAAVDASMAVTLEGVLTESDVISLHLPMTEATRHLISADALQTVRRGAVIVNVSRGGLVDEYALAAALAAGQVAGAGLDTFSAEPLPLDSPLRSAPNLIMTPHIAWRSTISGGALQSGAVHRARLALTGGALIDLV